MEKFTELIYASWAVLGQMSPYLIFGFLISGILSVFISPKWVEEHLGGSKFGSILKASLLGVPLPLCSCGVIPVSASLRKSGASKGATTSFLISTPQTGIDSILATYGLLGPLFAILRPLAALITGVVGGMLVSLLDEDTATATKAQNTTATETPHGSFYSRLIEALKYGFITLPSEISKALMVGIFLAGAISTFMSPDFVGQYLGNYYLTMLLMLFIGIPVYVCSTASIPVALGFLHLGVSPGAAFVFLISGPATNAAAITVLWNVLGKKSAIIYLSTVFTGSLLSGFLLDYLQQGMNIPQKLAHACHTELSFIETGSAIFMAAIIAISIISKFFHKSSCDSCCSTQAANPPALSLTIEGMSCGNCANAALRALTETRGVTSANVILESKQALIYGSDFSEEEVLQAVTSLGYKATINKPHC